MATIASAQHNHNVVSPVLIKVGKRQYRSNNLSSNSNSNDDGWDEQDDDQIEIDGIEQLEDGRFVTSVLVPSSFIGKLIGKKGEGKTRLEKETRTTVHIPKRGGGEEVQIVGNSQNGVDSCRTRIELLVESITKSSGISHFLSIPLPGMEDGMLTFKEKVLDVKSRGISDELFVNPKKMHLTIGTLRLYSDVQIGQAKELLDSCATQISATLGSGDSQIVVKGVGCMNDDPYEVDVLYANAEFKNDDTSAKLQACVDTVQTQFIEAGLMEKVFERDGVKLHATLMNSKFRRDENKNNNSYNNNNNNNNNNSTNKRIPFDASLILKKYTRFTFGDCKFNTMHLSRMVPKKKGHHGYYEAEHIANI